jgi:hypothetical protein
VDLRKALKSFPIGSAGGLSALRPDHLRDALRSKVHANIEQALLDVVNMFAAGSLCAAVREWLVGAMLIELLKKDAGIRPVAVGDVIRRVAGKCAAAHVADEAREFFLPLQVGVAVPAGVTPSSTRGDTFWKKRPRTRGIVE